MGDRSRTRQPVGAASVCALGVAGASGKLMSPLAGLKNMFSLSFFPRLAPWATRWRPLRGLCDNAEPKLTPMRGEPWVRESSLTPLPSPARPAAQSLRAAGRAGEGCAAGAGRGEARVVFPRSDALGYYLPPLTGLRSLLASIGQGHSGPFQKSRGPQRRSSALLMSLVREFHKRLESPPDLGRW
jgi:hypothetical protein